MHCWGKNYLKKEVHNIKTLNQVVIPTTNKVGIIKYGQESQLPHPQNANTEHYMLPVDWLKEIHLVDTPGTNAVVKGTFNLSRNLLYYYWCLKKSSIVGARLILHDIRDIIPTNSFLTYIGHQQITEHFVPKSDIVLFVISAGQAFSETEKAFLSSISQWKKKIVFILSKVGNICQNMICNFTQMH